ncbi:hypothetical protein GCM10009087_18090 [Sphingomonas oligophenolica]|uniref:GntR family transcriptional regulator n=1 Tax=Sphingomonas oligophenolica TaxID=301154 RepID=A0ABU9Y3G0_9SPHN
MNSGATADRVYDALKRELLSGAVLPGEKLDPTRYAEALNSSVTPVRDALHRLAGERLVESRPSEGFHLPIATEPALRDLYIWNASLLKLMVQNWPRDAGRRVVTQLPADLDRAPVALFDAFAARAGKSEMSAQLDSANDRLATARAAERRVLAGQEAELRALAVAVDHEPAAAILRLVTAYHRRRLHVVPDLIRAMYRRT